MHAAPLGGRRRRGAQRRGPRLVRPGDHVRDVARQRRPGRRLRRPSRTRSAPASPSRSTGSCPTTPTSPRSARQDRFTGLNPAYIDGSAVYHSPEDTRRTWTRRSLQHHGDNALALARAFGDADLAALATAVGGRRHLLPGARPAGALPRLAGLAARGARRCSPWSRSACLARRRELVTGRAAGRRLRPGLRAAAAGAGRSPSCSGCCWSRIRPGTRDMIDPWRPGWFRLAVVALVATVLLLWYGLLRAPVRCLGAGARRRSAGSPSSGSCWPPSRPAGPTWRRCRRSPAPSAGWSRCRCSPVARRAARLHRRRRGRGA